MNYSKLKPAEKTHALICAILDDMPDTGLSTLLHNIPGLQYQHHDDLLSKISSVSSLASKISGYIPNVYAQLGSAAASAISTASSFLDGLTHESETSKTRQLPASHPHAANY